MQRSAAILLLSVALCNGAAAEQSTTSNLRASVPSHSHQSRRELGFSNWFSTMLNSLQCVGPMPPASCHKGAGGSSGGGKSSGGSSASGSSASGGSTKDASSGSNYDSSNQDSAESYNNDSSSNGSSSSSGNSNGSDSYSKNSNGDGGNDDAMADVSYDDKYDWNGDGHDNDWTQSELGNGDNYQGTGSSAGAAVNVGIFLVGAAVAAVVGAALMATRKRRQEDEENHPLEGSLKKRMKLFSGGVFRKKGPALNGDVAEDGAPAFIEISSVRSGMSRGGAGDDMSIKSGMSRASGVSKTGSYRAPAESAIFENESEDSEEL